MAVFWFGWGKKLKNAVSKKEFQDTIKPLNNRITTLEQKKSLTTTLFYEIDGDWVNGGSSKFNKTDLTAIRNNFIVVSFGVNGANYSQVIYIPEGVYFSYSLPFIGISGYLSDTYSNVNVGFLISYTRKSPNYVFTVRAVKTDTNITLNNFKIYTIS